MAMVEIVAATAETVVVAEEEASVTVVVEVGEDAEVHEK